MTDPEIPAPNPPPKRGNGSIFAALGALVVAVLAKSKGILLALKGLSAGKLLLTFGSMLAMVAFEAQRSGWLFALGFVVNNKLALRTQQALFRGPNGCRVRRAPHFHLVTGVAPFWLSRSAQGGLFQPRPRRPSTY
jgi:hypothetical protein